MKPRFFVAALLALLLLTSSALAQEPPVRVALIDTGVLSEFFAEGSVEEGENYVFPQEDTQDRVKHGTTVADILLSVAPDAVIVPLVWYDAYPYGVKKNGGMDCLCSAIYDAVDKYGCDIINISAGIAEPAAELERAVAYAEGRGVPVISSVGNDNRSAPETMFYPACCETVVGVGAWDGAGAADFSQRSGVFLLAPGTDELLPGSLNQAPVSGTSYACPVVTGVCALILAEEPELTPEQLREKLRQSALDLGEPGYDEDSGWGLVRWGEVNKYVFADVSYGAWYESDVTWCARSGLFSGTADGIFNPTGSMSRAMAVQVLWRLSGSPAAEALPEFADVQAGAWYENAVAWAAETGLAQGYENGLFLPDADITRQQMTVLLWRQMGSPPCSGDLSGFSDCELVSPYAREAVSWAVSEGLILGRDGGLAANDSITRAEAAALLRRALERFPEAFREE